MTHQETDRIIRIYLQKEHNVKDVYTSFTIGGQTIVQFKIENEEFRDLLVKIKTVNIKTNKIIAIVEAQKLREFLHNQIIKKTA